MDGRTEDISEGGILVLSRDGCAPDQRVAVRFALPMEGKVVSAEAHVRWVRASAALGICAIGLEFVDLAPPVRTSIATYVSLMADHHQA
jgi:c-di-GMP-binding flagellar brake protein YcgR